MPCIAFYVSGHGLGHASRQIEIINALSARHPACDVRIRSGAPAWLFSRTLSRPDLPLIPGPCDTGIVQLDSLHLDAATSIERAATFYADIDARASDEAAWLEAIGAGLVVADTPPLACVAAARAGIPGYVVGNFTWDWIYAGYERELAAAPDLVGRLGDAYATATGAWRLPMWGGFATIEPVEDVPFVARHARHAPAEVRRAFDLPADRPLVLMSFGGYGLDGLAPPRLDLGPCVLVTTARHGAAVPLGSGAAVRTIDEDRLYASGYRYEDLVGAVDIVLTKPGYGIISECIANGTALVYTSRGHFAEYERLVEEMPRVVAAEFIDHADLFSGRWSPAFERVLARRRPEPPRCDGADVIAQRLLERLV